MVKNKSNVVQRGLYSYRQRVRVITVVKICCGLTRLRLVSPQHFDHCDDAYSLSIRVQTTLNHIRFVKSSFSPTFFCRLFCRLFFVDFFVDFFDDFFGDFFGDIFGDFFGDFFVDFFGDCFDAGFDEYLSRSLLAGSGQVGATVKMAERSTDATGLCQQGCLTHRCNAY